MSTSTTEANEELVREYLVRCDEGDPDALREVLAEEFETTHRYPSGGVEHLDREGFLELMGGYFTGFSELDHEVHETVVEGDRVMARISWSGVHDGEVLGIEPTGRRVEVEEFLSFRVGDDGIAELRWLGDDLDLLRQLGVGPPIV